MSISGIAAITGKGIISKQSNISKYFVSYVLVDPAYTYNNNYSVFGTVPQSQMLEQGTSFLVPGQNDLYATESVQQVGGEVTQNMTFMGWHDGNRLYLPGETYSVQNSNVTFTAQFAHDYWVPSISSILVNGSPISSGIGAVVNRGDILTVTGSSLYGIDSVRFGRTTTIQYFYSGWNYISDNQITFTVPSNVITGTNKWFILQKESPSTAQSSPFIFTVL